MGRFCYYINTIGSLFHLSNMLCQGSFIDLCMKIHWVPLGNIEGKSAWKIRYICFKFVLKQLFSTRGTYSLQGTFCYIWKYFQFSQLGMCYWTLVGSSQGCWSTSYSAQRTVFPYLFSPRGWQALFKGIKNGDAAYSFRKKDYCVECKIFFCQCTRISM